MVIIQDFINNNDNIIIAIYETPTEEDIGICNELLYKGLLYDIPTELREREVIDEGFALAAQINNIYVLKE